MPGLYHPVPRRPPASAPRCHAPCYPSPRQPSRQRSCHEFCFPPSHPHPPRQQSCHVGCCAPLHAVRVRQGSRRRRRHAPCLAASSFRSASPPLTRSATRLEGCAGTVNAGCSCDAQCARASRPRRSRAFHTAHAPRQRLTQACAPGQPLRGFRGVEHPASQAGTLDFFLSSTGSFRQQRSHGPMGRPRQSCGLRPHQRRRMAALWKARAREDVRCPCSRTDLDRLHPPTTHDPPARFRVCRLRVLR